MSDIESDFVHLARLALEGRAEDVIALVRRTLRAITRSRPDLSEQARAVLSQTTGGPTRAAVGSEPLPVDLDSHLQLLRRESPPVIPIEPTWPLEVAEPLAAILHERERERELVAAGLFPTKSTLFVGPPGVGKTLAARWLALRLGRPLLTLDLAAVMSSFLGRTGNNIRVVLDYARRQPSVLLLDEFDAIAKRRDDATEIGELKRLVTVLLQTIEEWPSSGVLIAATNHPELLDPAVWRRFDRVVHFPTPGLSEMQAAITRLLSMAPPEETQPYTTSLASVFAGQTFAEMTRQITTARRDAIVRRVALPIILDEVLRRQLEKLPRERKLQVAQDLAQNNLSQRQISSITGLARDTLRKHQ